MAEIINLRTARKQAARATARQTGTENAVRFGRTLEQKTRDTAETEAKERHLDQHKIERDE